MSYKKMPPRAYLFEKYHLDESTGKLFFKARKFGCTQGKECGNLRPDGYKRVKIDGSMYMLHRVVFYMVTGIDPLDNEIDHADRNRMNNSPSNLRMCIRGQNQANGPAFKNNATGYRGVHFHKQSGKYRADISINKKRIYLGGYSSPESAALAYNKAAKLHFGEFANLNRVGE